MIFYQTDEEEDYILRPYARFNFPLKVIIPVTKILVARRPLTEVGHSARNNQSSVSFSVTSEVTQ